MIAKHEPGKDVVAYFESNHGEFLGRMTRYIDEEGDRKEKDAYYLGETNGEWFTVYPMDVYFYGWEITEEQAREWVREMGHDPDKVFDF